MASGFVAFFCGVIVRTWRQTFVAVAIIWLLYVAWKLLIVVSVVRTTSVPDPAGGLAQVAGYVTAEVVIAAVEMLLAGIVGHAIRVGFSGGKRQPPAGPEAT